jgi:hypothetical protein
MEKLEDIAEEHCKSDNPTKRVETTRLDKTIKRKEDKFERFTLRLYSTIKQTKTRAYIENIK